MGRWLIPPSLENLPFHRAKTVVQCTSAGQLTGPRIMGELLLLKKTSQTKNARRATSDTLQNVVEVTPLTICYDVYMVESIP